MTPRPQLENTQWIYLASASPRRHELLEQLNVDHRVLEVPPAPGDDEPRLANESPIVYVQRTAMDKARRAVAWSSALQPILAADTTVALGDAILGKPTDASDAARILALLSDKTHVVHTAVVLAHRGQFLRALSTTSVTFAPLTAAMIRDYVASGEPFGKAGAYGIQGLAARFISRIHGSYSGVMGLPLFETAQLLAQLQH